MMKYIWLALFLIVLALLAALISLGTQSGMQPQEPVSPQASIPMEVPPPTPADLTSAQQSFNIFVSITDGGFQPMRVEAKKGDVIRFTNNSTSLVTLTSPAPLNLSVPLALYKYTQVRMPSAGTYTIINKSTGATLAITVK